MEIPSKKMDMIPLHFKNTQNQEDFNKDGFLIIDLPDAKVLELFENLTKKYLTDINSNFYYSLLENTQKETLQINQEIDTILEQTYTSVFDDFVVRSASFLAKPAHHQEEMYLHRDWSFTDIFLYNTGTLWIPLSEVNENNGAMYVIKGSHLMDRSFISASLMTPRIPFKEINSDQIKVLNIAKGQALIFNPHIWHGSFPNHTDQPRIVITSQISPQLAPFNYYHQDKKGILWEVKLSDDQFIIKNLPNMVFNEFDFSNLQMKKL